jgi:outer membrane receptor protein involved in Fe transport
MKRTFAVLALSGGLAAASPAQDAALPGRIHGRVMDSRGVPMPGIEVRLEAAGETRAATAASPDGGFSFEAVPAGRHRLSAWLSGRQQGSREAAVQSGQVVELSLTVRLGFLDEVTVTDSREEQLKRETAATVDVVGQETIDQLKPTHPGQIMGLVPGVWVNVTGGEGHQTAIRQPLTTNPVYLYLEDGVPSRSTGFFNHNALYEINVPQADSIEVTKGPSSALYGSDAIGGVVNVLTRSALEPSGADLSLEGGAYGFGRLLVSGNGRRGENGLRADANVTRTDGWRDATGYERQSFSLRGDRAASAGSHLKVLATYSHIDQETAGSSALAASDYLNNPTLNLTPISYRKVEAFRLSVDYARPLGSAGQLSLIPYFRYDTMGLLPNWTLTFDPTFYDTRNTSYGLLGKVRRDFAPWRMQWVGGIDLDLSPGMRVETRITPSTTPIPGGPNVFSAFTPVNMVYDYDVTYFGAAPYVNVELSPWPSVRASAGLRLDHVQYEYDDLLTTPPTTRHRRPPSATREYNHLSPKFGVTWQASSRVNAFVAYRHAFRVPSEGQLFRQGSALNTLDLEPVKAHNLEVGLRVSPNAKVALEASVYRLDKRDDILSFRDPVDGSTQAVNAGHTRHLGVETGARLRPWDWLQVSAAYAWSRHTYEDWLVDPARGVDFSGKEIETAPEQIGNLLVTVTPGKGAFSVEVVRLGRYWMDAANTHEYAGHTLVNLRAQFPLTRRLEVFGRLLNLADERYAESASFTQARGEEFAPGMPRTAYFGMKVSWAR